MTASSKGIKMSDSVVIRLDNYTRALKTDRLQRRVQRHMRPVRREEGSTAPEAGEQARRSEKT